MTERDWNPKWGRSTCHSNVRQTPSELLCRYAALLVGADPTRFVSATARPPGSDASQSRPKLSYVHHPPRADEGAFAAIRTGSLIAMPDALIDQHDPGSSSVQFGSSKTFTTGPSPS